MATFNLPDLGEGLQEAEIVRWHVKVGDRVKVDEPLLAVETAKAVVEVPAPYSGVVAALHGSAGDIVQTGAPLIEFTLDAKAGAAPAAPAAPQKAARRADDSGTVVGNMPTSDEELIENAVAGSSGRTHERVRAAPAVRALAKRLGVDLARLQGSGRGGLVTVDDVMAATGSVPLVAAAAASAPRSAAGAPLARASGAPDETVEKLRGLRRAMAHSMSFARDQVMGATLFDDADLHHWAPGNDFTVRVLRAIAAGARAEPGLNAWYDGDAQTRRVFGRVDVAMAVDTPEGLMVPVVRDVGARPAAQLRADVDRLKRGARDRSLGPEELRDYTFMLSNFGMLAGRYATPVVVPPAVAILGAGRLTHDVIAVMGAIETHLRVPLSLTFDHRCVTGGEAARFLAAVIADLAKPG